MRFFSRIVLFQMDRHNRKFILAKALKIDTILRALAYQQGYLMLKSTCFSYFLYKIPSTCS